MQTTSRCSITATSRRLPPLAHYAAQLRDRARQRPRTLQTFRAWTSFAGTAAANTKQGQSKFAADQRWANKGSAATKDASGPTLPSKGHSPQATPAPSLWDWLAALVLCGAIADLAGLAATSRRGEEKHTLAKVAVAILLTLAYRGALGAWNRPWRVRMETSLWPLVVGLTTGALAAVWVGAAGVSGGLESGGAAATTALCLIAVTALGLRLGAGLVPALHEAVVLWALLVAGLQPALGDLGGLSAVLAALLVPLAPALGRWRAAPDARLPRIDLSRVLVVVALLALKAAVAAASSPDAVLRVALDVGVVAGCAALVSSTWLRPRRLLATVVRSLHVGLIVAGVAIVVEIATGERDVLVVWSPWIYLVTLWLLPWIASKDLRLRRAS